MVAKAGFAWMLISLQPPAVTCWPYDTAGRSEGGPILVVAARRKAAKEAALCCHSRKLLTMTCICLHSPPGLT